MQYRSRVVNQEAYSSGSGDTTRTRRASQDTSLYLMLLTCMAINLDQLVAAPNLSQIASAFNMSPSEKDSRLGAIVQFGFYMTGAVFSILSGPITEILDRGRLLSGLCGLASILSILSGLVPSGSVGFFYFFLVRISCGVCVGSTLPTAFSLLGDMVPPSRRTTMSAFVTTSCALGAAIGQAISGFTGSFNWRIPYFIVAVVSASVCVVSLVLLSDQRKRPKYSPAASPGIINTVANAWMGLTPQTHADGSKKFSMEDLNWSLFRHALNVPTNRIIFAQSLPGCVGWSCITTFLPDYIYRELGFSVSGSTTIMGVFGIGSLLCSMTGSAFGQSLYNTSRATLPTFVATCTAAGAVPLILLVLLGRWSAVIVVLMAVLGGVAAATGPNLKGMLMNANPPNTRASVFSLFNLIDSIGKGLGPSVLVLLTWLCGGNRSAAFALAFSFWFLSAWLQLKLSDCFVADVVNLEIKTDREVQREPFDLFHVYHSSDNRTNS